MLVYVCMLYLKAVKQVFQLDQFEGPYIKRITAYFSLNVQTVSSVEWHRKGDYFSTLMPYDILSPIVC